MSAVPYILAAIFIAAAIALSIWYFYDNNNKNKQKSPRNITDSRCICGNQLCKERSCSKCIKYSATSKNNDKCTTDSDCANIVGRPNCSGDGYCVCNGISAEDASIADTCLANTDATKHVCDSSTGFCVQCTADANCASGQICDLRKNFCKTPDGRNDTKKNIYITVGVIGAFLLITILAYFVPKLIDYVRLGSATEELMEQQDRSLQSPEIQLDNYYNKMIKLPDAEFKNKLTPMFNNFKKIIEWLRKENNLYNTQSTQDVRRYYLDNVKFFDNSETKLQIVQDYFNMASLFLSAVCGINDETKDENKKSINLQIFNIKQEFPKYTGDELSDDDIVYKILIPLALIVNPCYDSILEEKPILYTLNLTYT